MGVTGPAPLLFALHISRTEAEIRQAAPQSPGRRRLRVNALHVTLLAERHDGLFRPAPSPVGFLPPPSSSPLPGSVAPSPGRHRSCRSLQPARPSAPDIAAAAAAILEAGTPPTVTRRAALGAPRGHFRPAHGSAGSSSRERREVGSRRHERSRERAPGGR